MKSQRPTRIALILISAAVLTTGCALKPKKGTSRFHQTANGGQCSCYTCQNSAGNVTMSSQPVTGTWVESSEIVSSNVVESAESFSAAPMTTTPFSTKPRAPYEVPAQTTVTPLVSSESFKSPSSAFADEQPEIQEVQPDLEFGFGSSKKDTALGGGSFKPMNSDEVIAAPQVEDDIVEAPKPVMIEPVKEVAPVVEPEVAAAKVVSPEPVEVANPAEIVKPIEAPEVPEIPEPAIVSKPVEIPEPVSVPEPVSIPDPVEIPTPVAVPEKVVAPAPTSTFKPGETFKPRKKKTKTLDTSWLDSDSQFQRSPSDERIAMAPQRVNGADGQIDSFFGRQGSAASIRQSNGNGKVVLRANPVERNVVYCPPKRIASKVVVPALQAGFKKQNTAGNWLRGVAQEGIAPNRLASVDQCNGGTCSCGEKVCDTNANEIVAASDNMAPAARVAQGIQAQPVAPQPQQVAETVEQPKKLAVKLRAIPMNEQMMRGKQVDVRFREHQPTQSSIIAEVPQRQPQTIAQPLPEPVVTPTVTLSPTVNLLESNPAVIAEQPALDRTARSTDSVDELVTPPWRKIK